MAKCFFDKAIFEDVYSAAVAQARIIDEKYEVGSNHVTTLEIISELNFRDLTYMAWRILQLHSSSSIRKALTYKKAKGLFSALGYGDIHRF